MRPLVGVVRPNSRSLDSGAQKWGQRVNTMPPQTNDAIENMRARIVAEKALNAAVNNRFTDKAPHLKRQLKFAADTLDDLERIKRRKRKSIDVAS